MTQHSVDQLFSALSDSTRRQVMQFLSERGGASASELADQMPVSRQAIVKHLSALKAAGLVAAEREGRHTRYHLTPAPLGDAMSWMADVGAEWDARLEALQRLLKRRLKRER